MTRLQTSLHDYQTLTGLVEHYSPTGDTAQAADWFVQRMKSLGFTHSFVDGFGNPTGVMGAGAKQIVLLGHIDTVPGKIAVEVRENLLYGRGSVDAKGPLAAFADAVAAVGEHDNWQLVVIGAIDEEGQSQAARFLVDQYQPLYTIIGEPSDWRRITIGYKGSAHATIKISQPVSHSASQEIGSCEKAFQVWQSILDWVNSYNQQRPRAFEQVTPALLGMHSGSDGFVEWAQIEIGTRLPIQVSPQDWKQRLIELTRDRDVEFSFAEEPISAHLADKNTPLVRAFLHAIRAQSERPGFVVKTGTADMNIVAPVWRGPILAYGPGDSTLDHTPDEHIDLNEYGRAVAVLQEALAHLMQ